jgi:hypothetical protein
VAKEAHILWLLFSLWGMDRILAPILQIAPEPQELCEKSSMVPPLESSSFEALEVARAPLPSQSLIYVDSGGVLAHSHESLFGKELCGLIASLEAASPAYGKDIACVLTGKASENIIMKIEKSLRKVTFFNKERFIYYLIVLSIHPDSAYLRCTQPKPSIQHTHSKKVKLHIIMSNCSIA